MPFKHEHTSVVNVAHTRSLALAGKLSGVQVTLSEGALGADVDIFVPARRSITQNGASLYVVDGVQVENALSVLNLTLLHQV